VNQTIKRSLHHLNYIIIFVIIACFMQYIHLFSVKDGDSTRNINIQKCLNLQSRHAAVTLLNVFVWSPGMSKRLNLSGGLA